MILIYDTETTGLPGIGMRRFRTATTGLGWFNWRGLTTPMASCCPWQPNRAAEGFTIPYNSTKIHGITTERAQAEGIPLAEVAAEFMADAAKAKYVMGHNVGFDVNVVGAELLRLNQAAEPLTDIAIIDSKDEGTEFCAIPGGRGGKFKWPTLTELHHKLLGKALETRTTPPTTSRPRRGAFEMVRLRVIERPEFESRASQVPSALS